jgi:hypothetical protein
VGMTPRKIPSAELEAVDAYCLELPGRVEKVLVRNATAIDARVVVVNDQACRDRTCVSMVEALSR